MGSNSAAIRRSHNQFLNHERYTGNDSRIRLGQGGALNLNQALAGIEADQLELRAV